MSYNQKTDFALYAKDYGISSLDLHYNEQKLLKNSLTPYILEERPMNVTVMDVFSRLMADRIIFLAGPVDERMSTITVAQLQYLDSVDGNDVTLQISSPGGSVYDGLSIIDTMNIMRYDIRTINIKLAASMGAVLLGAGTKGKRYTLPNSKTMIHQTSGSAGGTYKDAEISFIEWGKTNENLFKMLGGYCNKTPEQIKIDADRDLWFTAEETVNYGLIDEILISKK